MVSGKSERNVHRFKHDCLPVRETPLTRPAVERVLEYQNLAPEAEEVLPDSRPPKDWPQSGAIDFNDYSVRYREGSPLTLKNINLDIKAGERVGVVGRTGAGKSTLTLGL